MTDDVLLVLSTAASREEGIGIGRRLVEERLAACVNVLDAARSLYVWDGALQEADEALLLIKTRRDRYPALERRIQALHSYSVPEILAVPIAAGSPAYVTWLREGTTEAVRSPEGGDLKP